MTRSLTQDSSASAVPKFLVGRASERTESQSEERTSFNQGTKLLSAIRRPLDFDGLSKGSKHERNTAPPDADFVQPGAEGN